MPIVEDLPDLTHWRTVQEFSITQAALLLSGIDPYDYDSGLDGVKNSRHQRWKMAWGFSEGIISAIRRGVLTPVQCFSVKWVDDDNWSGHWESYEIKPTDRSHDISKDKTIITRDSLFAWVENEGVDFVRKPPSVKHRPSMNDNEWKANHQYAVIDMEPIQEKNGTLLLPRYEHKSEGLDFIDEAIKQFWSTYDPEDRNTAPKRDEVREYLVSKGATVNLAKAVDEVLRPFELKKGGRKSLKS